MQRFCFLGFTFSVSYVSFLLVSLLLPFSVAARRYPPDVFPVLDQVSCVLLMMCDL